MATVTFENATRIYPGNDRPSVDALNLEIADGEFLVLVGPSGCGKSTLLNVFSGAVREIVNGIVSNVTRVHVEVRRKGSYRSSLSGFVRNQVYGLLELPLAALSAVRGMDVAGTSQIVRFVAAGVLVVDALLGFFGTGIVVSAARWLSDLIEKHYVTMRMDMLKRCGQWASARHGR